MDFPKGSFVGFGNDMPKVAAPAGDEVVRSNNTEFDTINLAIDDTAGFWSGAPLAPEKAALLWQANFDRMVAEAMANAAKPPLLPLGWVGRLKLAVACRLLGKSWEVKRLY